ncbi:hypothetical protein A3D05_01435 [Candidatus Gottesmanbacteria bacterium RIFCSPHIGHO2_02_FULL_40_24]|uniref:DUF2270 domain-containing protein n=1 Tax=Candidatus Gottesmanbacteria bacterium RIFCSPHIGHO2_01_FULL_40_15 TaxID=1798376 RepID=A0A1F5Z1D2_9BACT|nr:MAG: hypothetical protein A2777_06460 [Candidatus Gottesmanbacteria bacterium RIFCSPHIGHO2_01_FULL_40_15]OGG17865.1 MAG: hypothetical protein A3D05_01435 [Candidatus Gottesmanbacteria bacterium RIFCSPHIGHO2_02_FULL_40_24]OGG20992.1 MAG: hypothetical protein A3B48_01510 [Candidatus Gottesmanbacteria bacterium RIFCSPLOWO2_01_FULL_40_10]OGG23349.1 MAG: hypothetical protein A3E42_03065 [Candidatus Gottesmanbacteria bacterium RIFCSPHIGHO2_12_FULL_40_13]OGG34008.1 MAG: hypothetical protein A3I80_0
MEDTTDHLDFLGDLVNLPEAYYGFIYHYYRAEVYRETNWRNRLDTTTNWSIVVTAAMLSFAFSNFTAPHSLILVNYLLVWFFLYVESRRFRYYWLLRERTRIIEKQLLSQIFSAKAIKPDVNKWKEKLSDSFKNLNVPMSRLESVAWRLRRNYLLIIPVVFASWLAKVHMSPFPAETLDEFFRNARVWFFPGNIVFTGFLLTVIASFVIAFYIPQKSEHSDLP